VSASCLKQPPPSAASPANHCQISARKVTASSAVSESLLVQHLKPPPPSAANPVPIDWESSTSQQ